MDTLEHAVDELPLRYTGPGGACAVLRRGEVIARHSWGWADAERRIAFTPRTLFRVCSITKQFTCALVLDGFADPSALDGEIARRLPRLTRAAPPAATLCHNQSGLRDYWAVAMLHGAPAESAFGPEEAAAVIGRTETLQFAPGTRYAYCNQNFRLLAEAMEARSGRSFGELLRARLFEPAGMGSAGLAADTVAMPDGTVGYEGSQASGFRPAVNRIVWTGDAGLGASLEDMIAWERWIDAAGEGSLYARMAAPVRFACGAAAQYGYGLGRREKWGREIVGHGGALRGWRSHRLYAAADRVSVVVMFNHMADAQDAAIRLLAAAIGRAPPPPPGTAAPARTGAYLEPETGLAVRIGWFESGHVRVLFDRHPDWLEKQADGSASSDSVRLRSLPGEDWMDRPGENLSTALTACAGAARHDVAGRYRCRELDAELVVVDAGGALYGTFSGFLGRGRMESLDHVGGEVWALPMPRALDHSPPGDWTLWFQRESAGAVAGVRVGCWLARGLIYDRVGD